jgi:HEAT repeat protein
VLEQGTPPGQVARRAAGAGAVADWVGAIAGLDDPTLAILPLVGEAEAPLFVEELLTRAFHRDCQPRLRAELASLAAALSSGERTASLLVQLESDDEETRLTACVALGSRGNTAAVPALRRAVDDESPRVRVAALRALCDVGGRQAGQALAEILARTAELDDELVRTLLQTVSRAGGDDAELCLLAHLEHARATVRLAALAALRALEVFRRTDAVRGLLADGDVRVRLHALSVLERHGGPADVDAVRERLSDPDPRVRAMARDALQALQRERVI